MQDVPVGVGVPCDLWQHSHDRQRETLARVDGAPTSYWSNTVAARRRKGRLGEGWLAAWCSSRRFAAATAMAEELGAERDGVAGYYRERPFVFAR